MCVYLICRLEYFVNGFIDWEDCEKDVFVVEERFVLIVLLDIEEGLDFESLLVVEDVFDLEEVDFCVFDFLVELVCLMEFLIVVVDDLLVFLLVDVYFIRNKEIDVKINFNFFI